MSEPRIDPDDCAEVISGFERLLETSAEWSPAPEPPTQESCHIAEARVSPAYAEFVYGDIDSIEYARRLRETVERRRASTPVRCYPRSDRARRLEQQARKAALFDAYSTAQRTVYEARLRAVRLVWLLAVELLVMMIGVCMLAFVFLGNIDVGSSLRDTMRDLAATVPDGVLLSVSGVTAMFLGVLSLVLRTRRSTANPTN